MTKTKINVIGFNIAIILTLVCISCTPVNKINTNSRTNPNKSNTNLRENNKGLTGITKNFKNKSNGSEDLGYLNQKPTKDIISKLKALGKKLEAQKEQENTEIAKIASEHDFLNTFKVSSLDILIEDNIMQIKRMIYPSLNYNTKKIETLKEILENLKKNSQNYNIIGSFLYHVTWNIQYHLDNHLELINNHLDSLSQKEAEELLTSVETDMQLKQRLTKTLKATIDDYNNDVGNIKTDEEKLANHMDENYKDSSALKPI
ncbi:complement regulator-acquiring protein (plasmid) [Borreliella yangtzensis]|uniref:complement regulator-acquiring protein n=1 Tax=Borreliella yangtzensis TaxID=683292 RepID=UPI00264A2138|nr:complement regulator-acquiring protein [Borreliella yangtzensis]WKC74841.1 complement regulator-acquiring protein [Borreliella yangtzensis]